MSAEDEKDKPPVEPKSASEAKPAAAKKPAAEKPSAKAASPAKAEDAPVKKKSTQKAPAKKVAAEKKPSEKAVSKPKAETKPATKAKAEKPATDVKPTEETAKAAKPVTKPARSHAGMSAHRTVVHAHARYVRTSARKARMVCGHLRGKSVSEARAILAFTPREVARDWSKLLESAVANAENNHELLEDDLIVREAYADEGPTIKRIRPRAMGRSSPIRKRTSHLTITLTPEH